MTPFGPATRWYRSAWLPTAVLLVVLCARWILVVGYGDFGTDYDFVSRLMEGQWQGRDFFAVFPFGSGYSLLLFEKLFGDRYVVESVHVWFWWVLNSLASGGIAVAAGATKRVAAFAVCAVALLAIPPNSHAVSFAFMASALSGLATMLMIRHFTRGPGIRAALAGVIGGAAVFAKPNVGVALIAGLVAICLAMAWFEPSTRRKAVFAALMVATGALCGALATLAIPGHFGGYREVLREIFEGGASIKGGAGTLLLRTVPRISTTIDSPWRFLIELAMALPLFAMFLFLFAGLFGKAPATAGQQRSVPRSLLWTICGSVLVLSLCSLVPWGFPARLTTIFAEVGIGSAPFFLWQILYLLELAALLVSISVGWRKREYRRNITAPLWLSILTLIWTVGVAASARHNSVFATTLVVPAMAVRMRNNTFEREFYTGLAVFLIGWTAVWHIAPNWRSTFSQLTRLPSDSKFAGLFWPDGGAEVPGSYPLWSSSAMIEQCQRNITPLVSGHSTLWMVPSAGAVFGGRIYRYGVNGLSANGITQWAEARLAQSVRDNPPEYIVASDFEEWKDGNWKFLNPAAVQPWLVKNYTQVWSLKDSPAPLFLWRWKGLESVGRGRK